jgi:hypothetical protein
VRSISSSTFFNLISKANPIAANDIPNRNRVTTLIWSKYHKVAKISDEEVITCPGRVSHLVDGWTSRNMKGLFAVCVSFYKRNGLKSGLTQRLLHIIPATCNTAMDLSEIILQHIFSKEGYGSELPRVGLDPRKVIAIFCDNAAANTVMVANIDK